MSETLEQLQKNELVQAALRKALLWLKEPGNPTVQALHKGEQGILFRLESPQYPYPLSIKLPLFDGAYSPRKYRNLIRKDWELQAIGAKTDHTIFPELIYCDPQGDFLIREYVEGEDLKQTLQTSSFAERLPLFLQVTELTAKVFPAFHHAAEGAYMLRDYRPKNILVEARKNRMLLIDCGSSKEEPATPPKKYKAAPDNLGENGYESWAPERLLDHRELIDRRIDFFSYGVMAYRILYHQAAYSNSTPEPEAAWRRYHEEYRAAEATIRADERLQQIRPELVEQLIGCLHPDAHKRFCGKFLSP